MAIEFKHHQSAHCENGVTSNLLKHHGYNISEPMAFGIGAGVFFSYLPFIKVNGAPGLAYRPLPGFIFKRVTNRLNIKVYRKKFSDESTAMKELDEALSKNIPVGCQVGVFNLPFFPPAYRFHFNAHNLVVFGKTNNKYLISDPVMEGYNELTYEELVRVRFAKGVLAPKGHMYYVVPEGKSYDLKKAVRKGISQAINDMLNIPIPLFGVKGIKYLAKRIPNWPEKYGQRKSNLYLGHVVRMQEEIGTGGGGFRFIYGAFLQEASEVLSKPELYTLSKDFTTVGDMWRDFAVQSSRIYKNRSDSETDFKSVATLLNTIADYETNAFKKLKKAIS